MSVVERAQREAVRRMLNGQHSRTFYDGVHFAATITAEQVEAAARVLADYRLVEWNEASETVRGYYIEEAIAAARAMGLIVERDR